MSSINPDYQHEWKHQKNKIRFREDTERNRKGARSWRQRQKEAEN